VVIVVIEERFLRYVGLDVCRRERGGKSGPAPVEMTGLGG